MTTHKGNADMDIYARMDIAHADIYIHVKRLSLGSGGHLVERNYLHSRYGTDNVNELEIWELEDYALYLRSFKCEDLLQEPSENSLWVLWD